MPGYQIRDAATGRLLAHDLANYCAAETAADRRGDSLEHDLAACGEAAGRISTSRGSRTAPWKSSATTSCSSASRMHSRCPQCDRRSRERAAVPGVGSPLEAMGLTAPGLGRTAESIAVGTGASAR